MSYSGSGHSHPRCKGGGSIDGERRELPRGIAAIAGTFLDLRRHSLDLSEMGCSLLFIAVVSVVVSKIVCVDLLYLRFHFLNSMIPLGLRV